MKVSRKLWLNALELARHATDSSASIVRFQQVRLASDGRAVTLETKTPERAVRVRIPADGTLEPHVVSHRELLMLSKAVKGDSDVRISALNTGLRVTVGQRSFEIEAFEDVDPAMWALKAPRITKKNQPLTASFVGDIFARALTYVRPAVCDDASRPHLNGVWLDGARMAATNGHCLHVATEIGGVLAGNVVFRSGIVIADTLRRTGADWVMARVFPGKLAEFSLESPLCDVFVAERLTGDAFAPIDQVIGNAAERFCVDGPRLRDAVLTAYDAQRATNTTNVGVKLTANGDLRVATRAFSEVLPLSVPASKVITLSANARYLADALLQTRGEVEIKYTDELDAIQVIDGGNLAIVMPMRA